MIDEGVGEIFERQMFGVLRQSGEILANPLAEASQHGVGECFLGREESVQRTDRRAGPRRDRGHGDGVEALFGKKIASRLQDRRDP